ncbi:MAG: rod shape-determining protein MreC [Acidobacteriota bacterium]
MVLSDTRHRTRHLFVAVMVGHILLISTQVNSRSGVPLLQAVLVTGLAETQRAAWAVVGGVRSVWDNYVALRQVHADNQRLQRELDAVRVQLQRERAAAGTSDQFRQLLDLRARLSWKTTGAEVIAGSVSPQFQSIMIDKGADDGVRRDMAVIAPAGVVGRVVVASRRASSVQLIVDRAASASALVERLRVQGIVLGHGDGTLRLEYLPVIANVQAGDLVVTAGLDGVYPKGLVLGHVDRIERGSGSSRVVIIKPAIAFGNLESVLIVLNAASGPPQAEDQVPK